MEILGFCCTCCKPEEAGLVEQEAAATEVAGCCS